MLRFFSWLSFVRKNPQQFQKGLQGFIVQYLNRRSRKNVFTKLWFERCCAVSNKSEIINVLLTWTVCHDWVGDDWHSSSWSKIMGGRYGLQKTSPFFHPLALYWERDFCNSCRHFLYNMITFYRLPFFYCYQLFSKIMTNHFKSYSCYKYAESTTSKKTILDLSMRTLASYCVICLDFSITVEKYFQLILFKDLQIKLLSTKSLRMLAKKLYNLKEKYLLSLH